MNTVARHLAEKAAADAGWERQPKWAGDELICRSARFQAQSVVRVADDGTYFFRCSAPSVAKLAATELNLKFSAGAAGPVDLTQLVSLLRRAAQLARSAPNTPLHEYQKRAAKMPETTEAERLVKQRVGQDVFRNALLEHWDGRCAVTGLDEPALLRASHARPWAQCETDEQRLDVHNGLLLAPHLDALFDGGWIGFNDDGGILLGARLTPKISGLLHLSADMRLRHVLAEHRPYLRYHRDKVLY